MKVNRIVTAFIEKKLLGHVPSHEDQHEAMIVVTENIRSSSNMWLFKHGTEVGYKYFGQFLDRDNELTIRCNSLARGSLACSPDDPAIIFRCSVSDPKFFDKLAKFLKDLKKKERKSNAVARVKHR